MPPALSPTISAKPLLVFDGECRLCNWAVNFILEKDRKGLFLFSPYQSEVGRKILTRFRLSPLQVKTVYLLESGRLYSKSTAFFRIVRKLSFPWNLLYVLILIPRPLRDCVYNFVATNRFRWFGEKNSCRLPDEKEKERFIFHPNGNWP